MLGYVKVPRIEGAFDPRNLLPSTALDPNIVETKIKVLYKAEAKQPILSDHKSNMQNLQGK